VKDERRMVQTRNESEDRGLSRMTVQEQVSSDIRVTSSTTVQRYRSITATSSVPGENKLETASGEHITILHTK